MKFLCQYTLCLIVFSFLLCSCSVGSKQLQRSSWVMQKEHASSFVYNNANINYIQIGQGEPVILIHGGGSWSYTFRENIVPLSKHFTVYAIDIPGHGYSGIPSNYNYTLDDINDLLVHFVTLKGIERAHFIGNSWGGGWAVYFAIKNSSKVRKLILISSAGLSTYDTYDKSEWKYLSYPFGKLILYFVDKKSVEDGYHNKLFFNKDLVTSTMVDEVYNPLQYEPNLLAQHTYQKNLDWKKTGERLHELKDVVFIWGAHDKYLPLEMVDEYKKHIPGAKVYVMDKSSHLAHEEEYEAVNQILVKELLSE